MRFRESLVHKEKATSMRRCAEVGDGTLWEQRLKVGVEVND